MTGKMHIYNAWLPPPVVDEIADEPRRFSALVAYVIREGQREDPFSRLETVKAIPVLNTFLRAKSDLAMSDVKALASAALNLILHSTDSLFIQQRWGHCVSRILRKYRHTLDLEIAWRPLHELLLNVHFERRHSYEGFALRRGHLNAMISLVQRCRRFFPTGAAAEIWTEFRSALDDISHNSALEGMGFLSLFLPSPLRRTDEVLAFYTSEWMEECLTLWDSLPHSNYWSLQWASLLGRCIKHRANTSIDYEPFLRSLYMHYLRSFEVPVGKSAAWPPVFRRIPREVLNAFLHHVAPMSGVVARSIVYLLCPESKGQIHLETLIDLLEQYYHPSNGGSWTSSLERFLRFLVFYFMKRVAREQHVLQNETANGGTAEKAHFLGPAERVAFVKVAMRLIQRGQYSKTASLTASAVNAAAYLSYLEPLIVLPHVVSCFQSAMDTITATHQLQSSLTGLALATRTLLLAYSKQSDAQMPLITTNSGLDPAGSLEVTIQDCRNVLVDAMFNTLLGLDANDPPKTLATLQLYSSVLSSVTILDSVPTGRTAVFPIDWSEWIEAFLSRLFVLLLNLEPPSFEAEADNGFLMNTGSHYSRLLTLLFGKATPTLYDQALKMVSKFVRGNTLPGAVDEIGMLCSVAVCVNPSKAIPQLVKPLMKEITESLKESPSTGFSSSASLKSTHDFKVGLSPALETTLSYQLKVLSESAGLGGAALPPYKEHLKKVISSAFDAPSSKVNEAGNSLLRMVIWSMVYYYPTEITRSYSIGQTDLEEWFSLKGRNAPEKGSGPAWHLPNKEEIAFVEELLELHLSNSLEDLRIVTQTKPSGGDLIPVDKADSKVKARLGRPLLDERGNITIAISTRTPGQEARERLRVILLRLDGSVQGVGSCLPDFDMPPGTKMNGDRDELEGVSIAGAAGATVGTTALRGEIVDTLNITCEYMLKERADDTILLKLLVRLMDVVGNFGATEYILYQLSRADWEAEAKSLTEPYANLITFPDSKQRRRPWWMLCDRVNWHNEYRASQARYHKYQRRTDAPPHVSLLLKNLLKLSLHSYSAVRLSAQKKVSKILKRHPALIKECIPVLTASLQNAQAKEETVLGACNVLMIKHVMRYLMQDWNALASFFLSLLSSSHHETIKAQNAISELFLVFNILYGGVPFSSYASPAARESSGSILSDMSYSKMIAHIQGQVTPGGPVTVHWRYHLMANGILLFLVLPPSSDVSSRFAGTVAKSRENMAGGFVSNLQSELPALRPISVIALLFLLQATSQPGHVKETPSESEENGVITSLKSTIVPIMESKGFGQKIISNLAVDHHYFEGQNSYVPQQMSDVGLTSLMPTYMRDWPRTRTWDSLEGEAFSSTFARLFQYLVQECGSIALETLRRPLLDACGEVEERGKQCIAAEIMAGLLHSNDESVVKEWESFFRPLLHKVLLTSTMESAAEWAACVRFAVAGEGKNVRNPPTLRYKILDCLGEPLPQETSTSLLTKRLTFLRAALIELLPHSGIEKEIAFQRVLLQEIMKYTTHRAPQVRQGVGRMMCMICANLQQAAAGSSLDLSMDHDATAERIDHSADKDQTGAYWTKTFVESVEAAAKKIRIEGRQHVGEASTSLESYSQESKEAVRFMETALHFMMAVIRSGNGPVLMTTLVELLHPLLTLQETWNKELAKKAKTTMVLMRWQPFGSNYLGTVVKAVLHAATDNNWHTRDASLKFMQPLIYRHTFIMPENYLEELWKRVQQLLVDPQLEVREVASTTLAGMMKGEGGMRAQVFRETMLESAKAQLLVISGMRRSQSSASNVQVHGLVLGLSACVLSVPYDMPRWLPEVVVCLARFIREPWPIRATVTKTIGEFRRTHMDTWDLQKASFSEDQLEVLSDLTSSASYFA